MIRQAHTYLVGAMGGATLIAIAIAVFVVLVSAQVVKDWPLAGLGGGGDDDAAVSDARPASATVAGPETGVAADNAAGAGGVAGADADRQTRTGLRDNAGSVAPGGTDTATGGGRTSEPGNTGGAGGGQAGGSPQATGAPSPGSGAGSGAAAGGGGKTSGGGGGSSGGGDSASPPSGQVTSTVNNTVNQVDESALGGTLGKTGVTETTEGIVNGVAGPESTVGKVVDEAVGAVGGILGGGKP